MYVYGYYIKSYIQMYTHPSLQLCLDPTAQLLGQHKSCVHCDGAFCLCRVLRDWRRGERCLGRELSLWFSADAANRLPRVGPVRITKSPDSSPGRGASMGCLDDTLNDTCTTPEKRKRLSTGDGQSARGPVWNKRQGACHATCGEVQHLHPSCLPFLPSCLLLGPFSLPPHPSSFLFPLVPLPLLSASILSLPPSPPSLTQTHQCPKHCRTI